MDCLEKDPAERIPSARALLDRLREPLPVWVWAVSAAAAVLVGALAVLAFWPGEEIREAKWQVGGEDRGSGRLALPVRDERDLLDVDLLAGAGEGRPVTGCSQPGPGAACSIEDGRIRVRFPDGPSLASLPGSTLRVTGRGKGFRVEGTIDIVTHREPPIVGEMRILEAAGPPRSLPAVRRLRSEVRLVTAIAEDYPRPPILKLERLADGAKLAIPGEAESPRGETAWTFPLSSLSPGPYRGNVEVHDEAGNPAAGKEVSFEIDNEVSLSAVRDAKFVAGKTAFFALKVDEPLADLKVLPGPRPPSGDRGPPEIGLPRFHVIESGAVDALELATALGDLEPVDPRPLLGGRAYLLGIPLADDGPASFVLAARDTATPPNRAQLPLSFTPPRALSAEDVRKISLRFPGERSPAEIAVAAGGGRPEAPPTRHSRIERIDLAIARGRIHRGACTLGGARREAAVEFNSLGLDGLDLAADAKAGSVPNEIAFELVDPLERTFRFTLSVPTDIRKPQVTLRSRSGGREDPRYHRTDQGKEIDLWLEADEELADAGCSLRGESLPGKRSGPRRFEFDLGRLTLAEGTHRFRFDAADRAGNRTQGDAEIIVDTAPPRVKPLAKEVGNVLQLEGNDFRFEIQDGNGVDYDRVAVRIAVPGLTRLETIPIARPKDDSNVHAVSLDSLPDECEGTLAFDVADRLGLADPSPKEYPFRLQRRSSWRPVVKGWQGVDWVHFRDREGKDLYISRTEISNRAYLTGYRAAKLRRPRYWGEGDRFPTYRRKGEGQVPGDRFPVVGIGPEDAEAFGRTRFGARLPTWDEWRAAAWRTNNGHRYPWKDEDTEAARDYTNTELVWESAGSPFSRHPPERTMSSGDGRGVECRAVEVDFDPFPDEEIRQQYGGDILHMIGNVGELVKTADGSYGIAGGDYKTALKAIDLRDNVPIAFERPDAATGFRLVIPLAEARADFRRAAREERP